MSFVAEKKGPVFPGQFLTVEEEYLPGHNTFEQNGKIFSSSTGKASFDDERKEVSVHSSHEKLKVIDPATIVIGQVILVKDSFVVMNILEAEKDGEARKVLDPNSTIFVSRVSQSYVKSLYDMFKIGDLVKAKVTEVTPTTIELATNENQLGVIKAFCGQCRQPMMLVSSQLKCKECGSVENRKLSDDYILKY